MENGFIILDKPNGLTSQETVTKAKEKLNARKAGHAGTLDKNVTGVLLIGLNNATKLMPLIEALDKEYVGKAHLHKDVELKKLNEIINKKFIGKIKQVPPRKSRVARIERERKIYCFNIIKKENENFEFIIKCEKGTYIRKIMDDLGKEMKVGCQMTELRRTKQGPFSITESVKLENLNENNIIESEKIIERTSAIVFVNNDAENKIKKGKFIEAEDIENIKGKFEKNQIVAIFNDNKVIALGKTFFNSEEIKKQKGFVMKPERII